MKHLSFTYLLAAALALPVATSLGFVLRRPAHLAQAGPSIRELSVGFGSPAGIAVEPNGTVYVADTEHNLLCKVSAAGVLSRLAGSPSLTKTGPDAANNNGTGPSARFYQPQGVAVAANGTVYVADTRHHTIRRITPAGVVTTLAGLSGQAGSADGKGELARFNLPTSVALGPGGVVYVADQHNHTIRKITPAGVVTTLAGKAGDWGSADGKGPDARFHNPISIATDDQGRLYVADRLNYTIRRITPAGVVSTLAGAAGVRDTANGTGPAAHFADPMSVAVNSDGLVYVADCGSGAIRAISPAGRVLTVVPWVGTAGRARPSGLPPVMSVAIDTANTLYVASNRSLFIIK